MWGSIFSFERNKFFWKIPHRLPYPMSIHFGPAIAAARQHPPHSPGRPRTGGRGRSNEVPTICSHCLASSFAAANCVGRVRRSAITMGGELSASDTLLRPLILRRLLRRHALAADEKYVGVLLPPSVPGLSGEYGPRARSADRGQFELHGLGRRDELTASRQAGIKHVITSRRVMDKMNLQVDGEIVYLEDLKDKPTLGDKVAAATQTYALPAGIARTACSACGSVKSDDVLTIIFTSGSHGHAEGGDADACQRRHECRSDRASGPPEAQRRAARRAAVLPFVRLHRHAVGRGEPRYQRGLSLQPARCQADRQA